MRIRKLEIKDYRNLKNVTIEFGNFTILIGKNDAGKSNILKALDLFFNGPNSKDITEIVNTLKGGNEFVQNMEIKDYRVFPDFKPATIKLVGYVELDEKEIKEIFPDEKFRIEGVARLWSRDEMGNIVRVEEEFIAKRDKKATFKVTHIEISSISLYDERKGDSLIRQKGGHYAYKGAGKDLPSHFLRLLRKKFLIIPAVRKIETENRTSEKALPDGKFMPSEFLRYEKEATMDKEEEFKRINKEIQEIFPQYTKVASKTEDNEKKVNIYFGKFPSSSVGSGINQFFVNIFNLNSYENVIFGIEEPEIHLHPEAQRKAFEFLKQRARNKQIIITTHSSIFTDCSDDVKLYLVKKNPQRIATVKEIENKAEFKIIKYEIGARNTDLFFYNMVLLVEGDTEERAIPIIIESLGESLDNLGIKQINIRGKDRLGRIKEFLRYIKDSDVKIFVLLDKDEGVKDYIEKLKRESLIGENDYHIWSKGAFIDCFKETYIIQAMKNIYGKEFDMDEKQLEEEREKGKLTEKILAEYLHNKNLGELNKPALGEEMALIIKQEIESGKERDKTEAEKIIKKIIETVKKE